MKKLLAIILTFTMLAAMCSFTALANTQSLTNTVLGGKWAEPYVLEDIVPSSPDTTTSTGTITGNSITFVPSVHNYDQYKTENIDYGINLADNWKNTGAIEIGFDVEYHGTINTPDFFTVNIGMTTYNTAGSRSWLTGGPNAEKDFTFTDGGAKNIKWIVEFTDTQVIARHYNKRLTDDKWTYVRTVVKDWAPAVDKRELKDIHIYSQHNFYHGKTQLGDNSVTVSNFYVKEIYLPTYLECDSASVHNLSNVNSTDIEYTINENYKNAKLEVGGITAAELNCEENVPGSYVTTFDLRDLTYTGVVPVVLTVTDKNGNVTTKTSSITVVSGNDRELVASTDFDGNDEGMTFSYTADHVKPNGKTGNGISVTNIANSDAEKFATITGGNNAVQINGIRDLIGYCYDIEFDMYQTSNANGTSGKSGTIVKNWYNNGTSNVTGWKTGSWNWIQNHTQIAGTAGKYTMDTWHAMKYTINTVDSTLSAYDRDTGELLGTVTYVNDGVDYLGLAYAVYTGVDSAIQIDNISVYKYVPGTKPGIASVSVDPLTKAVSVTADVDVTAENVTSELVKLNLDAAASVALADDGRTIVITPSNASALKGKDGVITFAESVIGTAVSIPVSFPEDYSNRRIAVNDSTGAVTGFVDIIAEDKDLNAGIMYIAFYKNGNLAEVHSAEITTSAAGLATYSEAYTPVNAYDDIRVFVWSASNTPLLKVSSN